MLSIRNLTKVYNKKTIIKNISLDFNGGETTSIIGPSGAGKTTLLRCLSLLETPDEGDWNFNHLQYHFPSKVKLQYPYPKLTVVFQQYFLWPHLTNRENILLSVKVFDGAKKKLFDELISYLHLENFLGNYPNQSSVGQKQRVALARALILEPEYLILDEVTSSLDFRQIRFVEKIINDLKNKGVSVILITHSLDLVKNVSDRVIFMENGSVVEQGTSEILHNPKTKYLKSFLNGEFSE